MNLPDLSSLLPVVTIAGEFGVCSLALARRLWRQLPFFTLYLCLVTAGDFIRWCAFMQAGPSSALYAWAYWLTQAVLLVARAAALADLCRAALGNYLGVWHLAKYMLAGGAALLLVLAGALTAGTARITSYAIVVERELEVTLVVTLLLLLMLSRYYGVVLGRPLRGIILGLVLYSSIVVINTSVLIGPLALPWPVYSSVRILAYLVALGIWAHALWLPLAEPARPQLSTVAEFERESGEVDRRMRELNARLLQLMKK
jgi:hypothetical protein